MSQGKKNYLTSQDIKQIKQDAWAREYYDRPRWWEEEQKTLAEQGFSIYARDRQAIENIVYRTDK